MRPCRDEAKIKKLITEHNRRRIIFESLAQYESSRVDMLNDYLYELRKPGYKSPDRWIVAGTTLKNSEPVIQAGDTHLKEWGW